jgi:membrane protein
MDRFKATRERLVHLFETEIWLPQHLRDRSLRGRWYAILRVISITVGALLESSAASRAAALSFSSLVGLGPLISLTVLIAGFTLDERGPSLAAHTVHDLIRYVAPPLAQYEKLGAEEAARTAPAGQDVQVNPELVRIFDEMITSSRSGAVGIFGALTLIVIVLQLFTSVETTFNEIWGVRRGRSWLMRIVFYWTILTLGALFFFAAATGLSATAILTAFAEKLPFGQHVRETLIFLLPLGSTALMIFTLTIFYRTIPNTRVLWRAALIGAVVVGLLILLNNFLAFLYFKRVLLTRSLYGSLGIGLVLMLGLYVFWFFVLLGGTVSYAVQNVHFRNSQAAWNSLAESVRERLTLVVLLLIGRRFEGCQPPCTTSQLSEALKVPAQIVNECVNRLVHMGLITPVPGIGPNDVANLRYQPARPLSRVTLRDFKRSDDALGDSSSAVCLANLDPVLEAYDNRLARSLDDPFFSTPLSALFEQMPFRSAPLTSAPTEQAEP